MCQCVIQFLSQLWEKLLGTCKRQGPSILIMTLTRCLETVWSIEQISYFSSHCSQATKHEQFVPNVVVINIIDFGIGCQLQWILEQCDLTLLTSVIFMITLTLITTYNCEEDKSCNYTARRLQLTMRKELRFILRRIVFSIWDTFRKILNSSFSLSRLANNADAEPCKYEY